MTTVIINPGTGPCVGTTRRNADANMRAFIRELGVRPEAWGRMGPIERGRYGYRIDYRGKRVLVDMPGLPLERVRYTGAAEQNAWHFPRLYINSDSWLWKFAVPSALDYLGLCHEANAKRDERDMRWAARRREP